MSDESIDDLLAGLNDVTGADAGEDVEPSIGEVEAEPAPEPQPSRRIVGLLALVLGVVGSLLAVLVAVVSISFGFGASDRVDQLLDPVDEAFGRLETRIDQADDLVTSGAVETDELAELQARVDGMVDLSTAARRSVDSIEDHPLFGRLPTDVGALGDDLAWFEERAEAAEDVLARADDQAGIDDQAAADLAADVNEMQARVSSVRDRIDSAASGLRRWARLTSFIGFFGSLWGLWAQVALARRGWQRLRGRST